VYVKGKGLDGVRDLDDLLALPPAQRAKLRFGVFTGSPLIDWMLENDLLKQVEWYQVQSGDADQYPGQVIERDLASGKIDVAFVWGPIAGYFARNTRSAPIVAVQLKSGPGIKLDFDIAMAVRHSDKEFKQRIDKLIDSNQGKIDAILDGLRRAAPRTEPAGAGKRKRGSAAMTLSMHVWLRRTTGAAVLFGAAWAMPAAVADAQPSAISAAETLLFETDHLAR
jgi:hypothetical protein